MRGITTPSNKPGWYVVRVSVNGKQEYVGTYRSLDVAVARRDERRMMRHVTSAPPLKKRRARRDGVHEEFSGAGTKYQSTLVHNGRRFYGGRFDTAEAAAAKVADMRRLAEQGALGGAALPPKERNIRFIQSATGLLRFGVTVRNEYRGSFDTLEEARRARDACFARDVLG